MLEPVGGAVPEPFRVQIDSALGANDLPGAVATATGELLRQRVREAVSDLVGSLQESGVDYGILSLARFLEQTEEDVLGQMNRVRDLTSILNRRIIPITFVIMALALAGIVWIHSHNLRDALRSTGITLLIAGIIVMVAWLAVSQIFQNGLEERFTSSS